uniref:Uncharacterized protein n=1 Tax=Manihot esculenta TaxID=3983 RepID=A0A199UB27_MANES
MFSLLILKRKVRKLESWEWRKEFHIDFVTFGKLLGVLEILADWFRNYKQKKRMKIRHMQATETSNCNWSC